MYVVIFIHTCNASLVFLNLHILIDNYRAYYEIRIANYVFQLESCIIFTERNVLFLFYIEIMYFFSITFFHYNSILQRNT